MLMESIYENRAKFLSNLKFAFTAQLVSLTLSILLSLVAPKILGVEMYSFWQLFIFYTTYVNIFHFGISDGLYLRLGGKSISRLIIGYWALNFIYHLPGRY